MKILFARFFNVQDTFSVEHTAAIARYLTAKGHNVSFGNQYTDWSDFEAVYFDPGIVKANGRIGLWQEQLDMLLCSIEGKFQGQQRWVTNCDPVLSPKSLLLQLGMAATAVDEYTHVLRLPGQPNKPWSTDTQFSKYAQYNAKLSHCDVIMGDWWMYPDIAKLLRYRRLSVKPALKLAYSGWPKGDRMDTLTMLGVSPRLCSTYEDFAKYHGDSAAALVLSSPGHCGATTLRLSEVLALTVMVAGPDYQSNSYLPKFTASNKHEANEILDHVNSLSKQGRQHLLDEQLADLVQMQTDSKDICYV
jgi:hypothetical protein